MTSDGLRRSLSIYIEDANPEKKELVEKIVAMVEESEKRWEDRFQVIMQDLQSLDSQNEDEMKRYFERNPDAVKAIVSLYGAVVAISN